jgi:hypothetical protein
MHTQNPTQKNSNFIILKIKKSNNEKLDVGGIN